MPILCQDAIFGIKMPDFVEAIKKSKRKYNDQNVPESESEDDQEE